jgi:DNA-binding transcriptional regulator GbsR (MarR family)
MAISQFGETEKSLRALRRADNDPCPFWVDAGTYTPTPKSLTLATIITKDFVITKQTTMPNKETSLSLSEAQVKMVAEWVRLADSIGLPRSYAQIYGFLFISKTPVTAQDCVEKLKISRSSAGQGLKILRDLGAIRPHFELGSRAEAFTIEPDLGIMIRSIVESKLAPAFDQFFNSMATVEKNLDPKKECFELNRIAKLNRWRSKLARMRRWIVR